MEARAIKVLTYADYCELDGDGRYELVDGDLIAMNQGMAGPGMDHVEVSSELFRRISNSLANTPCRAYHAPCDVIFTEEYESEEEAKTVLQPDIIVLCDLSKRTVRGCVGAPDLVVEILSPYSLPMDMRTKHGIYERFGVSEYWIIDPFARIAYVYNLVDAKYVEKVVDPNREPLTSSVLSMLAVDLSEVFARMMS